MFELTKSNFGPHSLKKGALPTKYKNLLYCKHNFCKLILYGRAKESKIFTEATTNETLVMVASGSGFTAHVCRYVDMWNACKIEHDDDRVTVLGLGGSPGHGGLGGLGRAGSGGVLDRAGSEVEHQS